jgi:tripartite ATP-independent transporter DctM subunit
MNSAGVTNRIFHFALSLVGWLKGGLGHVNILASVIFSGMSGAAIADAGGLGTIEIKAMKDNGYPTKFAVGVTAASATIGPIIPPSLPMVIYGVQANVSIGQLFTGGFIPGFGHDPFDDGHGHLLFLLPTLWKRCRALTG